MGWCRSCLVVSIFSILAVSSLTWADDPKAPSQPLDLVQQLQQLNASLQNILQAPDALLRADNVVKLIELTKQRKEAMLGVMKTAPETLSSYRLSTKERKLVEPLVGDLLEKMVTIEGELNVIYFDNFKDSKSERIITLRNNKGQEFQLYPFNERAHQFVSGHLIKATGISLDNSLVLNASLSRSVPDLALGQGGLDPVAQSTATDLNLGEQKTLVLLFNFQNTTTPALSIAQVESAMNEVNAYYQEVSFGKVWLRGAINPTKSADVLGWYQLPFDHACSIPTLEYYAGLAANNDVNFTNYSRIIIIAPFTCPPWRGIAQFGTTTHSTPDGAVQQSTALVNAVPFASEVIIHELGHNFENGHAASTDCPIPLNSNGCTTTEYGDWYDVMGEAGFKGHFNAQHKESSRWLAPPNIVNVTQSGQYAISPIETLGTPNQTLALKIQRDSTNYLYIEYRQPLGAFDAHFQSAGCAANVYNGALLHLPTGQQQSLLVRPTPGGGTCNDILPVNSSVFDPKTGNTITTISKNSTSLTVNVAVCKNDFSPPVVTFTNPLNGATVSGQVTVTAAVTDPSGIKSVEFFYQDAYATKSLGTDLTAPYQATMDTTRIPNGPILIWAYSEDLSGDQCAIVNNQHNTGNSPTIAVQVLNTDNVNPTVTLLRPANGSSFTDPLVTLSATASDNNGIWKVEFYQEGIATPLAPVYNPSALGTYDSMSFLAGQGSFGIYAVAFDYAGNSSVSATNSVVYDSTPPTVSLSKPSNAATLSCLSELIAQPVDNVGIARVEFYVNNSLVGNASAPPYRYLWDTRNVPDDSTRSIYAKAIDLAGNSAQTTPISVIVHNRGVNCSGGGDPHCVTSPQSSGLPGKLKLQVDPNYGCAN